MTHFLSQEFLPRRKVLSLLQELQRQLSVSATLADAELRASLVTDGEDITGIVNTYGADASLEAVIQSLVAEDLAAQVAQRLATRQMVQTEEVAA